MHASILSASTPPMGPRSVIYTHENPDSMSAWRGRISFRTWEPRLFNVGSVLAKVMRVQELVCCTCITLCTWSEGGGGVNIED